MAEKLELLRRRAAIGSVDVAKMLGTTAEAVSGWNHGRAYPRPDDEKLLVDLEYIAERLSEFYSDPGTASSARRSSDCRIALLGEASYASTT